MRQKSFSKNIGAFACRQCGVLKTRVRAELDSVGKFVYREENGLRWNRLQCNSCMKANKILGSRKNGTHLSRFLATDHKNYTGLVSENRVMRLFEENGYSVMQSTTRGPDLLLVKNDVRYSCEVKTATRNLANGDCWYVSPVYPKRRGDDLMSIVMPNNKIHVEPMEAHLFSCSPSGRRSITELVRAYRHA